MEPIWKDYTVELASSAVSGGVLYRVLRDSASGTIIFEGRAYPRPGASDVTARINDIVAPYLVRGFTPASETDTAFISIFVQKYSSGSWVAVDSVDFYADWSYDNNFDEEEDDLNDPPENVLLPLQRVPCSKDVATTIRFVVKAGGEYEEDIDLDEPCGAVWLDLRDYPDATEVSVNGRTYYVLRDCSRFVLYYVNAYGGWDTFAIRGKTEEFDDVEHFNQEQVYNNSTPAARGKRNYVNELTHRYTFHTAWMGEAASLRMHHLLNSPLVLCHDVVRDIVRPVVLTNTLTEHKHGGRLYQYTIEAGLAQNRVRR